MSRKFKFVFVASANNHREWATSLGHEVRTNICTCLTRILDRLIAHELNHVLRWDSVGYGKTLGKALVSEGLAGQFAKQLFGSPPELWEDAASPEKLSCYLARAETLWDDPSYDHDEWFFGSKDIPRWAGYTLGYQIVGEYLRHHPSATAAKITGQSADKFKEFLNRLGRK